MKKVKEIIASVLTGVAMFIGIILICIAGLFDEKAMDKVMDSTPDFVRKLFG